MKIFVENLGAVRQAEIELSNFTIICGRNNSGKTYVTYAIYGFFNFWNNNYKIEIPQDIMKNLENNGVVSINLCNYKDRAQETIDDACAKYSEHLERVFSAGEELFKDSCFKIKISSDEVHIGNGIYEHNLFTTKSNKDLIKLRKERGSEELIVTSLSEVLGEPTIPSFILEDYIGKAIKIIVFGRLFPDIFIASAERTGVAIFRKELDFARNKLLNELSSIDKSIKKIGLISEQKSNYALPVEMNVEFNRILESICKQLSYISKERSDILDRFADILGGEYDVTENKGLYFTPSGENIKLTMDESSSSVRSMLDIGFYLKHAADKGDILMIDEPELNLHPENQRKFARLLSCLINCGIKVFITTHSDYILKELSTLIMLNSDKSHIAQIIEKEHYSKAELLDIENIKVYITEESKVKQEGKKLSSIISTLVPANIDIDRGIEAKSFDYTIDEMNRIQEEIIFGG